MRILLITVWIMITLQLTTSLPAYTNLANVKESENNEMRDVDPDTSAIKSKEDIVKKISSTDYGEDADSTWDYDSDQDYDYIDSDKSDTRTNDEGHQNSERKYRKSKSSRNAQKSCASGTCNEETIKNYLSKDSPREMASNIAIKAAQDARAASDAQCTAAKEAAHHVKAELAEKALQAAKAAEAALAGKKQVMEQLKRDISAADAVLKEELIAKCTSRANQKATKQASQCANQQFKALSAVLDNSKDNLDNLEKVRNGAEQELAQKNEFLDAAKNRLSLLRKQLKAAEEDQEKTKCAAYRAACDAVEAQQKACQPQLQLKL